MSMKPIWFKNHTAYTMAKYGMSMCVLGMAAEFEERGLAVNALWPKTGLTDYFFNCNLWDIKVATDFLFYFLVFL